MVTPSIDPSHYYNYGYQPREGLGEMFMNNQILFPEKYNGGQVKNSNVNANNTTVSGRSRLSFSPSELKLMEKILLLAGHLEQRAQQKYVNYDVTSPVKRRLLLLTALTVISRGLGVGSRLLQLDHIISVLIVLAQVPIEVSLRAVRLNEVVSLLLDIKRARLLRLFHIWRKNLRIVAERRLGRSMKEKVRGEEVLKRDLKPFLYIISQRKQLQQQGTVNEKELKAKFLKIWRVLLNYRMVRNRTRRRVKTAVVGRMRKLVRVTQISNNFYGKKVKLRVLNRWFNKRFGNFKIGLLRKRMNLFLERRKGRIVSGARADLFLGSTTSPKDIFSLWRMETRARKARKYYSRKVVKSTLNVMSSQLALTRGKIKTGLLYNEIRLLKGAFYKWYVPGKDYLMKKSSAVRNILLKRRLFEHWTVKLKEKKLLKKFFGIWREKGIFYNSVAKIASEMHETRMKGKVFNFVKNDLMYNDRTLLQKLQTYKSIVSQRTFINIWSRWRFVVNKRMSLYQWAINSRNTEDLRNVLGLWKLYARSQVIADTFYQRGIAESYFSAWKEKCKLKTESKTLKKDAFKKWRRLSKQTRCLRFFTGQILLRKLGPLSPSPFALSRTISSIPSEASAAKMFLSKATCFYRWFKAHRRENALWDRGDQFFLQKMHKILATWRSKTAFISIERTGPQRMAVKVIRSFKKVLKKRIGHEESCEKKLFTYLAGRVLKLQIKYFKTWEQAFQVAKLHEHVCEQKVTSYEQDLQRQSLKSWKLLTALKIFTKCQSLSLRPTYFKEWRRASQQERRGRDKRLLARIYGVWSGRFKGTLAGQQEYLWNKYRTLRILLKWRELSKIRSQEMQKASDFNFIVRTQKYLDRWHNRAMLLKLTRQKLLEQTQMQLLQKDRMKKANRVEVKSADVKKDDETESVDYELFAKLLAGSRLLNDNESTDDNSFSSEISNTNSSSDQSSF